MSQSRPPRLLVSTLGALAVTAGLATAPAHAAPPAPTGSVAAITDHLAARLAGDLADDARRASLLTAST
ncbi:MAG: S1 family peptidase, partial [Saccharothrix sp.]|nr:S1 family peptidase [Saccharothrix sp.]